MSDNIRPTHFSELGYTQIGTRWRIIDTSTGSFVGPHYPTMRELLADLDNFATVFGCNVGKMTPTGRVLSNKELAQIVWRVDYFLACCGVNQEDANYVINNALELVEAWENNPEDMATGLVLADWLLDQNKPQLADEIRKAAYRRGNLGTGT